MPEERQQREEYTGDFLPEVSIYDIRIEINIINGPVLTFKQMKAQLATEIITGRPYYRDVSDYPLPSTLEEVSNEGYFTTVIASYLAFRINQSLERKHIKGYLTNCREREGSYIMLASMVLEALVTYNELREALERIEKDLESISSLGNFHVTRAAITPRNTTASRIAHQHLALAQRKAMTARIMSIALPIILCAIATIIVIAAKREEHEDSKKIEVTINPQGTVPVSIPHNTPATDSVSAKSAKHQ
jgi:hypothetical protein